MKITIDRIEGDKAIVEFPDMTSAAVPVSLFPDAKEGDVYLISKDMDETVEREKRIRDKFNSRVKRKE